MTTESPIKMRVESAAARRDLQGFEDFLAKERELDLVLGLINPDEHVLSYLSRLRKINCHKSLKETLLAATYPPLRSRTVVAQSHIFYSNLKCKIPGKHIQQLSTYRFDNLISPFTCQHSHSPPNWDIGRWRRMSVFSLVPKRAAYCPSCVQSDLSSLQYAYWRTAHQLLGATYCLEHGDLLRTASDGGHLETAPQNYLLSKPTELPKQHNKKQQVFLIRYADIASRVIDKNCPYPRNFANQAYRNILKLRPIKKRPFSSFLERAISELPSDWITSTIPMVSSVDANFLYSSRAPRNFSGALLCAILALLFDSTDDAVYSWKREWMRYRELSQDYFV